MYRHRDAVCTRSLVSHSMPPNARVSLNEALENLLPSVLMPLSLHRVIILFTIGVGVTQPYI